MSIAVSSVWLKGFWNESESGWTGRGSLSTREHLVWRSRGRRNANIFLLHTVEHIKHLDKMRTEYWKSSKEGTPGSPTVTFIWMLIGCGCWYRTYNHIICFEGFRIVSKTQLTQFFFANACEHWSGNKTTLSSCTNLNIKHFERELASQKQTPWKASRQVRTSWLIIQKNTKEKL